MTFLLTGAGGQVGQEIIRWAGLRDFHVLPLRREELDVSDPDAVESALRSAPALRVVINSAAYTDVDRAEHERERALLVNRDGPKSLATVCASLGIPLIHMSTDHVFDGTEDGAYCEEREPEAVNAYGRSKLEGEKAIRQTLREHVILRTSWVFGRERKNFVKTMLRLAASRSEVEVVKDEEGCPTGAGQIAHAVLTIASLIGRGRLSEWGVFHFAGRPVLSRASFAREIFRVARTFPGLPHADVREIPASEFQSPARRPRRVVLEGRRTREELGIHAPSWKPYLTSMLRDLSGYDGPRQDA